MVSGNATVGALPYDVSRHARHGVVPYAMVIHPGASCGVDS
jgi:hypothetical protein